MTLYEFKEQKDQIIDAFNRMNQSEQVTDNLVLNMQAFFDKKYAIKILKDDLRVLKPLMHCFVTRMYKGDDDMHEVEIEDTVCNCTVGQLSDDTYLFFRDVNAFRLGMVQLAIAIGDYTNGLHFIDADEDDDIEDLFTEEEGDNT